MARFAAGAIERLERGDDRTGEQATGAQVGARAPQESHPLGHAAEQLEGLHRHEAQGEVAAGKLERPRVRAYALHLLLAGPALQRSKQVGVEVERGDTMARTGEIERHPARAGADIEDRVTVALGQLPPQRQIRAIGAALQVVPHDLGRGHDHALLASPRATSSSRRASIAV